MGRAISLSFEERKIIEEMLNDKYSQAEIARALNRTRAAISRELKVNKKPYNAQEAQNLVGRRTSLM